jgi:hypothetical protein
MKRILQWEKFREIRGITDGHKIIYSQADINKKFR